MLVGKSSFFTVIEIDLSAYCKTLCVFVCGFPESEYYPGMDKWNSLLIVAVHKSSKCLIVHSVAEAT